MHSDRDDDGEAVITLGLAMARNLLDGLIAYRTELGELGRELEGMLRAAGVTPSTAARRQPGPDGPRRKGTLEATTSARPRAGRHLV
jgi:hypothetical protein